MNFLHLYISASHLAKWFSVVIMCSVVFAKANATTYYVNDNSLTGDIYTTAVGAAGNSGTAPNAPKALISQLPLATLVAGDIVYIDAGIYTDQVIITSRSGAAGNMIRFIGAGETLTTIQTISGSNRCGFRLLNSSYINIEKLKIQGNGGTDHDGIIVYHNSDNNEFQQIRTQDVEYGIDMMTTSDGVGGTTDANFVPENNKLHDCYIEAKYVGIRVKCDRGSGGFTPSMAWSDAWQYGPINNEIYDNTIVTTGMSGNSFAVIELHATGINQVYRNVLVNLAGVTSSGGSMHLAHSVRNVTFTNNYILNLSSAGAQNFGFYIADNFDYSMDFIHNSIYTVQSCFYAPSGANNFTFRNNILYSTTGRCIDFNGNNYKLLECVNNHYYFPGGTLANTSTSITTLAAWQTYNPDNVNNEANAIGGSTAASDPQFTNPAAWDLDLPAGSPSVDAVYNIVGSVSEDIYSTARPEGARPDIGAFEIAPLPVQMLNFNATCQEGSSVSLTWTTLWESENDYFTIEKSNDGINYVSAGVVNGQGNTAETTQYSFTDHSSGTLYYRLRQTDIDGTTVIAAMTTVRCNTEAYQVWTNNDHLYIVSKEQGISKIEVYMITGQLIKISSYNLQEGINQISLEDLSESTYLIRVYLPDGTLQHLMIVK